MGMSDCVMCWDTPCTCGYDYRNMSRTIRIKQAAVVLGVDISELEKCDIPETHPIKEKYDG